MTRLLNSSRTLAAMLLVLTLAACHRQDMLGSAPGSTAASTAASPSVKAEGQVLTLSAASYTVSQGAGVLSMAVDRNGGSTGSVTVSYATSDGSALAGADYTATSGTLQWASGDSSEKTVLIPISNVTPFAGDRTFTIALSDAAGAATLGTPSSATVTISGTSGESSLPSAPTGVELVNQGGPNVSDTWGASANELTNYQAIEWRAAVAGNYPVSYYQVYRNGIAYAKVSAPTEFKGYIAGTTLTVTAVVSGSIIQGARYLGTGVAAETMIDAPQLSGSSGGAGTYQVNIPQYVASASAPVTLSAWQFIDTDATSSNDLNLDSPTTAYSYSVAAVDTQGQQGPLTSQYAVYGYQNGYSNWSDYNFDYGNAVATWNSVNGDPQGGPYDVEGDLSNGGGLLFVAGAPQSPEDELSIGGFNYFTIDINPGSVVGYQLPLSIFTRVPPGDVPHWTGVPNLFAYGPAPVANTWATYKIPLAKLGIGTCTITGSISGTTLTVTAIDSGPGIVDAGGFVTGSGVPAGTYISAYGQAGPIGTFTVAGPGISSSTSVPSEAMTYQRTSLYKLELPPNQAVILYLNNFGFTTN